MEDPLLVFCPYPTIHSDGSFLDGTHIPQSKYCKEKCKTRECLTFKPYEQGEKPGFYTCKHGFSVVVAKVDGKIIRINSVVESTSNTASKNFKKDNKHYKLKLPELYRWLKTFEDIRPEYEKYVEEKAQEAVHALHDIKSLIGSILTTAEQYINEQKGRTIDEKIEASPTHIQTIYHSCEILQSLLQITDILTNPAVAQYGEPWPFSIHGVIMKLIKIHENRALSHKKELTLRGHTVNKVKLYNSFIIIPHILIDNAIKHSDRDSEIRVWIQDKENGEISINFSSYGYLVPEDERVQIFQRGFRGSNARAKGSGLGLYIAQLVAKANGFEITYKIKPTGILGNNKGYNHFMFTIPTSAPKRISSSFAKTSPLSDRSIFGK